jgi:hypothetical protein
MLSKEKVPPENSVLFSLQELRRLQDERVEAEASARRAQAEAERRAKAEAEQRARDEEARRVREEEERRQRSESEREDREREDRLRVEEAERRARVEGELKLREQQLLQERTQRRRSGRPAWVAVAAGAALFVAVAGGLAAWVSRRHQAETKALELEIARRSEQARAAQLAFDARIHVLEEKARRDLVDARTVKEQARIPDVPQREKQVTESARLRPGHRAPLPVRPAAAPPRPAFHVPRKPKIDDNPLGDLPAIQGGGF